jgi:hypothetical protein
MLSTRRWLTHLFLHFVFASAAPTSAAPKVKTCTFVFAFVFFCAVRAFVAIDVAAVIISRHADGLRYYFCILYVRRTDVRRAEGWHFCFHICFSVWVFIAMDVDGPRSFFEYLVSLVYILGISLPIDLSSFPTS